MRRNIISTILEVLLPIILISLFLILKTAYDVENKTFEEAEFGDITNKDEGIKYFIQNRSIVNVDLNNTNIWNDLQMKPILKFCEGKIGYTHNRSKIAIVKNDDIPNFSEFENKLVERIKEDVQFFRTNYKDAYLYNFWNKNSNFLKEYDSVEKMEDTVKNEKYGGWGEDNDQDICFGISSEKKR
jgi:hypothetical protein